MDADIERWFRRFHPSDAEAVRLVCFPHAGGSASYYQRLSAELSPSVDVLAVQYPGRMGRHREAVVDNLDRLVDLLVEPVLGLGGQTPAFFGHSMGAVVAFEVARRLAVPPAALFVSGRVAPPRSRYTPPHLLSDEHMLAELREFQATDLRLLDHPKARELMMPVLRGDYRAIETYQYRPGPALDCPIAVFAGSDDPVAPVEDTRPWRDQCTGEFCLRVFSGGHFFLNDHLPEIARDVRDRLRRVNRVSG